MEVVIGILLAVAGMMAIGIAYHNQIGPAWHTIVDPSAPAQP